MGEKAEGASERRSEAVGQGEREKGREGWTEGKTSTPGRLAASDASGPWLSLAPALIVAGGAVGEAALAESGSAGAGSELGIFRDDEGYGGSQYEMIRKVRPLPLGHPPPATAGLEWSRV